MTITQIRTARCLGISLVGIQTLMTLADHEEIAIGALAVEVGVSSAAMTRFADSLAKRGWIRRVNSRSDRRSITVVITEKGRAVLYQITGREAAVSA